MDFGTILAVLATLAIFSFLYGDNPIYRVAESILVGLSIGYTFVVLWNSTFVGLVAQQVGSGGGLKVAIPVLLGLLMLSRLIPGRGSWSRLPLAIMIGSGAGVAIPAMLDARTLKQISASIAPLLTESGVLNINGLIVIVGVLSVLSYFYFSRSQEGALGRSARIGGYFLMIFFGTTFGYTVMSRMSTLIGRLEFLISSFQQVR